MSNSTLLRVVFVDDSDPSIVFSGPWSIFEEDFTENLDYGPVYRGSQHRLVGGSGGLTFRFRGSDRVRIFGTTNARNVSGVFDPAHTCTVDGVDVEPIDPWFWPVNKYPLCGANLTYAGDHTITLSAVSNDTALYVDLIEYIPDRIVPPENPTLAINEDDVAVEYFEGAWKLEKGTGMLTQEAGARMSIRFTGSKATWIGGVPESYPRGTSTATYSLDGGPPITFDVPGLPSAGRPLFGQSFFEVSDLGPGEHELIVAHEGPSAPLVFDYLLVEDGDIFMTAPTGVPADRNTYPPSSSPTGRVTPSRGKKTPVGAIAGGVGGAVVLILGLVALVLLMMKRRKRRYAQAAAASHVVHTPEPKSPLSMTYEVAPLLVPDQTPPNTNNTGDSSLHASTLNPNPIAPNQPPMAYYGYHTDPSMSSYSTSPPSMNPAPPSNISPLAPVRMTVNHQQPHQGSYPRIPEPMA